jgi:hypothetical protein
MYLFHTTTIDNLDSILTDGALKSYDLLKKEKKNITLNYGFGLYETNNFVYFSCIDKMFSRKIYSSDVVLYFDTKFLYNTSFYVSTMFSEIPDNLYEEEQAYRRKYNKNYKLYNLVLRKLYNQSISVKSRAKIFQILQQVAIRNKVSLDNLVGIEFKKNLDIKPYVEYIKEYYPDVKIIIK